jgi:predicted metal-dependent phosphoesterase TrpH
VTDAPGGRPPRNHIDLHTHTRRSDGVLEPAELLRQMTAAGMTLVAITDHDTLAGAAELAAVPPPPGAPRVITGIEINTVGEDVLRRYGLGRDGEELHILGYGLDPADPVLAAALERQRSGRRDRIALTLERVRAQGMTVELDPDDLDPTTGAAVGRPHVARALIRAGYATDVNDAFEAITAAGGIASLAHSVHAPERPGVFDELMDWGLRGLEVYYPRYTAGETARMATFAAERGLLATGGSDYHGDHMDYVTAQDALLVPAAVADRLLEALAR